MAKSMILFALTLGVGVFVETGLLQRDAGDVNSGFSFSAIVPAGGYSYSNTSSSPAIHRLDWESPLMLISRNESGLTFIGIFSGLALLSGLVFSDYRKRKINVKSLEIQLKQLEKENAMLKSALEQQLAQTEEIKAKVEFSNRSLTTCSLTLAQKDTLFEDIRNLISESVRRPKFAEDNLLKVLRMIDNGNTHNQNWEGFKTWFEQVHPEYYRRLKKEFPKLSSSDLRLCALIRLSLNSKECARILGISPDSVKVSRHRIRRKMNLDVSGNLVEFLSCYDVLPANQNKVEV
jgi:DNA-binding CsgD family transcriptional regulator